MRVLILVLCLCLAIGSIEAGPKRKRFWGSMFKWFKHVPKLMKSTKAIKGLKIGGKILKHLPNAISTVHMLSRPNQYGDNELEKDLDNEGEKNYQTLLNELLNLGIEDEKEDQDNIRDMLTALDELEEKESLMDENLDSFED